MSRQPVVAEPKAEPKFDPQRKPELTLLSDAPLRELDCDDECFGLGEKLGPVYDAIRHPGMGTPFAVMVTGDWGTGKTSAMRWLERQFKLWEKHGKGSDEVPKVKVTSCWFHPWKYQKQEDVWKGLIAEIILASIDINGADSNKVLKAASQFGKFLGAGFVRLLSAVKPKVGVPGVAEISLDTKEALGGVIEEYSKHVTPHQAYFNAFEETLRDWIQDCYKPGESRLCVFIDDLDRCMPDIALQVLEALKLYLNIPELVFVVGVDKTVINKIVVKRYEDMVGDRQMAVEERKFEEKALQYLDKMFQVTVDIAPPDHLVKQFLKRELGKLKWWNEIEEGQRKWLQIAIERAARENPRAVVRKVNSALLGGGHRIDPLERAQSVQIVLLKEELAKVSKSDVLTRADGRAFLRAWSESVKEKPDDYAHYLPLESPEKVRGESQALKAEPEDARDTEAVTSQSGSDRKRLRGETPEERKAHLLELALRHPTCAMLLRVEEIGLLLRVPFPDEEYFGAEPEPDEVSREFAEIVAQRLGIAPELVTKQFLTGLEWLTFNGTQVTDAGLVHLKGLTGLRVVGLDDTQVTDEGLAYLKGLTALQQLYLGSTPVTSVGLAHLRGMAGLHTLSLRGTQVTDAGLESLSGLTGLQRLSLIDTKVTDSGLAHLKGLTRLQILWLNGTQVTDSGLVHLEGLTELQELFLGGTKVTDAGLAHLKGLTRLQILWLNGTQVTDSGLVHLEGLTGLKELFLGSTQVTKVGVAALQNALANCEIHYG